MAKVSVIVPVYKVEDYLNRCVDSILNQTFEDFELILVDDGSPDNCGAMCDEYAKKDGRIHVIHQKNGGLSAARNAGIDWMISNSESEWITFIDSDDWIHSRYIELLYNSVLEQNTLISMCMFQRVKADDDLVQVPQEVHSKLYLPENAFVLNTIDPNVSAYAWGRLYHKSLFKDIRYPVGKLWEDLHVTHKLLFHCENIAVVEEKLYYYFVNADGIVNSSWNMRKLDSVEGFEQLIKFFENRPETEIHRKSVLSCCETIYNNIFWSQRSLLPISEKRKAKAYLQKKMVHLLIHYRKRYGITMCDFCHYYEVAFPVVFEMYRIGRPILKYPNIILKKIRNR